MQFPKPYFCTLAIPAYVLNVFGPSHVFAQHAMRGYTSNTANFSGSCAWAGCAPLQRSIQTTAPSSASSYVCRPCCCSCECFQEIIDFLLALVPLTGSNFGHIRSMASIFSGAFTNLCLSKLKKRERMRGRGSADPSWRIVIYTSSLIRSLIFEQSKTRISAPTALSVGESHAHQSCLPNDGCSCTLRGILIEAAQDDNFLPLPIVERLR